MTTDFSFETLSKQGLLKGFTAAAPFELAEKWTLLAHALDNTDWSAASYIEQGTVDTLQGFCVLFNTIFYDVDPENGTVVEGTFKADRIFRLGKAAADGGMADDRVWTVCVPKEMIEEYWKKLLYGAVGGTIDPTRLCRLEISPKPNGNFHVRISTHRGGCPELMSFTDAAKHPGIISVETFTVWKEST